MASLRPQALILLLAPAGALAAVSGGTAWAQPVSSARVVQAPAGTMAPTSATAATPLPEQLFSTPAASLSRATPPSSVPGIPANAPSSTRTKAPAPGLAGRVTGSSSPLPAAGVYAYQLSTLALHRVETDPQGNFLFRDLPAGLYKVIALKSGFSPVMILLTRTTAQAYQFLELQLTPPASLGPAGLAATSRDLGGGHTKAAVGSTRSPTAGGAGSVPDDVDFWALRASLPPDVLRQIETAETATGASAKAAQAALPAAGGPDAAGATGSDHPDHPAPGSAANGTPAGNRVSGTEMAAALADSGGRFRTQVQAMTGVAAVPQVGSGQVSTGTVGIEGQLGKVQVGLSGQFWQLTSDGPAPGTPHGLSSDGQTSALSLDLQAGSGSKITVDSLSNHLAPRTAALSNGAPSVGTPTGAWPGRVGLDHYQVSWSQALGEGSRSDFAAQYTSESNYHRLGNIDPIDIPDASRTWRVEGSYTTATGDNGTLQAGVRYSELQLGAGPPTTGSTLSALSPLATASLASTSAATGNPISPGHQTVDLFSRGSSRLQPAFMVEYGLYTTLQDGSLSLTPQGGLVLQLGNGWQARGSASHRVYQQSSFDPEFLPTLFKESDLCQQGGKACYELSLSNHGDDGNSVTFSAIERIVGQTLRLYFSEVVFDRLESLYLVAGDRLPEMHVAVTRRLSPQVRTSLESSFATGGGGIFTASDGRPYRNQVRYVVASLDTRFLNTATGVFLAFHHLTQDLAPLSPLASLAQLPNAPASQAVGATAVGYDRLQLMLSQDLNCLWNLASEWAVQVNMELTRGDAPYLVSNDTQLHRRILGGIAVKF
jgi:Carboxypeptidase regulatory-like domain